MIKLDSDENMEKVIDDMITFQNKKNAIMSSILNYDSSEEKEDNIKMANALLKAVKRMQDKQKHEFRTSLSKLLLLENELSMIAKGHGVL